MATSFTTFAIDMKIRMNKIVVFFCRAFKRKCYVMVTIFKKHWGGVGGFFSN